MADSVFGLKIGDYILWKGPDTDSAELIGKVARIHQNRLGKQVKKTLGIPISGEPYAVIELENGVLTDLDSETDFERVEVQ
ncbi:MAG TPA: hypothetical protein VMY18_00435 [Acidobacteriota bacterium]|nr:hypothetical protein [Acidobacteriota bacterium]